MPHFDPVSYTHLARDKRKLKETISREANMRHLEINEKKNK